MKAVLLVLLLSGCVTHETRTVAVVAHVPAKLRACPAAIPPAAVPPTPRTLASIVAYANETERRRAETAHAFEVCRARLIGLLRLMEERP